MNLSLPQLILIARNKQLQNFASNHVFAKRITSTYELVYFNEGTNCKMLLNDRYYHLQEGTVVFRKPNMLNQSFMPYESIYIQFDIVTDHKMSAFLSKIDDVYHAPSRCDYKQLFFAIYNKALNQHGDFDCFYYGSKLLEILYHLYEENTNRNLVENAPNDAFVAVLQYINEHIDQKINLATLSKEVGISERSLYAYFKEAMQETPITYINRCKINRAKKMLLMTDLPIHEIAMGCGFDTTYFIKCFKKIVGTTPTAYRKMHDQPTFL